MSQLNYLFCFQEIEKLVLEISGAEEELEKVSHV